MVEFKEPTGEIRYHENNMLEEEYARRQASKAVCESLFAKWMQRFFVEFRDGDETNFRPDNLIGRTLEFCVKNYDNELVFTNLLHELDERERLLVSIPSFREAIYYAQDSANK